MILLDWSDNYFVAQYIFSNRETYHQIPDEYQFFRIYLNSIP